MSVHEGQAGPQLRAPALNTVSALLIGGGSLLATQTEVPAEAITASLFGPAPTLLSADPRIFWIWWAIVAAMAVFIIWQWLPDWRTSKRLAAISWPALVAGVAHLGWILLAHNEMVIPFVVLLAIEIGALCLVSWRLAKRRAHFIEHLCSDTGWGLTLGFVTVEMLTAVGVVFESYDFGDEKLYFIVAVVAYAVFLAGALGMAGRLYRQVAVGIGLLWGFAWVAWDRLLGEPRSYILGAMAAFGCFILLAAFYASGRRRRAHVWDDELA